MSQVHTWRLWSVEFFRYVDDKKCVYAHYCVHCTQLDIFCVCACVRLFAYKVNTPGCHRRIVSGCLSRGEWPTRPPGRNCRWNWDEAPPRQTRQTIPPVMNKWARKTQMDRQRDRYRNTDRLTDRHKQTRDRDRQTDRQADRFDGHIKMSFGNKELTLRLTYIIGIYHRQQIRIPTN